jgi:hypothetical protein
VTAEAVSVVVALARKHGLWVERPVVLRDVVNRVVMEVPLSVLGGKLEWWRRRA